MESRNRDARVESELNAMSRRASVNLTTPPRRSDLTTRIDVMARARQARGERSSVDDGPTTVLARGLMTRILPANQIWR